MLITRSDDGYFGLRQSLTGAFDKAVSSCCDKAFEEHGLTDEGKTVAPILLRLFVPKAFSQQRKHPIVSSFHHTILTSRCKIFSSHKEIKR